LKNILQKFWEWYERHYVVNVGVAAGLFLLQAVHLVWLFGDIIIPRLGGSALFGVSGFWEYLLIIVDYTEIPALISVSVLYIHELWKNFSWKSLLYLCFLNIQWVHLFWITDEFVVQTFTGSVILPFWLAWCAIAIDYLELPVIVATIRKFFQALKDRRVKQFLQTELRD